MKFWHKELAEGRWFEMPFLEQMANIGSDVERAISWRNKANITYSTRAIERAMELLCLTIEDKKNRPRLKELTRLREFLIDYFYFDNAYNSSDEFWRKYFYAFACAANKKRNINRGVLNTL